MRNVHLGAEWRPFTALLAAMTLLLSVTVPGTATADDGTGTITGTITAFDDGSVEGVCVSALNSLTLGSTVSIGATVEADGTYRFEDLPNGYYLIYADDCRPQSDRAYTGLARFGLDPDNPTQDAYVEVTGGTVGGIDLEFTSTTPRERPEITGTVRLPEDHGISRVCVRAASTDEDFRTSYTTSVPVFPRERTEVEYQISIVPGLDESYYVEAHDCDQGRFAGLYNGDPDGAANTVADAVAVDQGDTGIDLTLGAANSLSGQVTTADGEAADKCILISTAGMSGERLSITADEDGNFTVAVIDGSHTVQAFDCAFGVDNSRRYLTAQLQVDVVGNDVSGQDLSLIRGAELTGQVTGPDGEVIENAFLQVSTGRLSFFVSARSSEEPFLLRPLPEGELGFRVFAPSPRFDPLTSYTEDLTITTGADGNLQDLQRTVTLTAAAAVRWPGLQFSEGCLRVIDLDADSPLTDFLPRSQLHTGEMLATGLPPGTYEISYGCSDPVTVAELTVTGGEVIDLTTLEAVEPPAEGEVPDDGDEAEEEPEETLPAFGDVPLSNVHAENIARLVDAGITAGCEQGAFCPNDVVTRDQMATFLTRALELEADGPQPFSDVTEGSTHDQAIRALVEAEITGGCGEGLYCPRDEVNRAQMATFLTRALDLEAEGPQPFEDVLEGSTHDRSIRALVEAEITGGCGEGLYCPGDPVTRAQMASFLVRALDL